MENLKTLIKEYLKGFFTDINVYSGVVDGFDAIAISGFRCGNKYDFGTNQVFHDDNMLFNWLGSIKDNILEIEKK